MSHGTQWWRKGERRDQQLHIVTHSYVPADTEHVLIAMAVAQGRLSLEHANDIGAKLISPATFGWKDEAASGERLEKFERDIRAARTLGRAAFVEAMTLVFRVVKLDSIVSLYNDDNHRRLGFRFVAQRGPDTEVLFHKTGVQHSRESAAGVIFDFLSGEHVEESCL